VGQSITTAGCGQTKRVIEQMASSTKTTCVRQPRTCVLIESGMAPTDKTVGAISAKMARHHRGDGRAIWQYAGSGWYPTAHQTLGLPQARGATVSRDNLDEKGSDNQSLKWRPVAKS
jgi:hypothetical protein